MRDNSVFQIPATPHTLVVVGNAADKLHENKTNNYWTSSCCHRDTPFRTFYLSRKAYT